MTTQEIYDELLKEGYTIEFLSWFISMGVVPSRPKTRYEEDD